MKEPQIIGPCHYLLLPLHGRPPPGGNGHEERNRFDPIKPFEGFRQLES